MQKFNVFLNLVYCIINNNKIIKKEEEEYFKQIYISIFLKLKLLL